MDVLHYFTNVLGIREVMLPVMPAGAAPVAAETVGGMKTAGVASALGAVAGTNAFAGKDAVAGLKAVMGAQISASLPARLLVLDEPGGQALSASPLFVKMIEAMGLSLRELKVLEYRPDELARLGLSAEERALPVLSFSPALTQVLADAPPALFITTFGPRDLAKNDQLKRQTWTDLQALMKKMGISARPKS